MKNIIILIIILFANNLKADQTDSTNLLIEGYSVSVESANTLLNLCQEQKIRIACTTAGKIFEFLKKDLEAIKSFSQSCSWNHGDSCLYAGYAYERLGKISQANDLYTYGCHKLLHGKSCTAIGQNYRENREWLKSLSYFTRGCQLKNGQSCFFASEMVSFANANYKQNLYLLKQGCQLEHPNSCYKMGYFSQMTGDISSAREGYRKACILSIDEACEDYKIINNGGFLEQKIQKIKKWLLNIKDIFLIKLETMFPIGPQS